MTHDPGTPWSIADVNELKDQIDALQGKKINVNLPRHEIRLLSLLGFITAEGKPVAPWELIHQTLDFYRDEDHMSEFTEKLRRAFGGDHDETEDSTVSHKRHTHLRHPHVTTSGYSAAMVAKAYNLPAGFDGSGMRVGIIELGGAYSAADLTALGKLVGLSLNPVNVTVFEVQGTAPVSDGPNGADGEVALDVQIVAQTAPGAKIVIYNCPNTDAGFVAGINQAVSDGVDAISISWGGPESQWDPASITEFEAAFASAKAKGIPVFVAAGDSGSKDGTRTNVTDYPSSSPNTIGCGGTRLVLDPVSGTRISEIVWDDNPTSDATGGGISKLFPNRTDPDVAGNADPVTGWLVVVDGNQGVIGGTSAVAPWYAGAYVVTKQAYGKSFDLLAVLESTPTVCFDITVGNNGGFKATVGKDDVSGYGSVDFGELLAVLSHGTTNPAPPVTTPPVTPPTTTTPSAADVTFAAACHAWLTATGL